jgi:hypothetical protein
VLSNLKEREKKSNHFANVNIYASLEYFICIPFIKDTVQVSVSFKYSTRSFAAARCIHLLCTLLVFLEWLLYLQL